MSAMQLLPLPPLGTETESVGNGTGFTASKENQPSFRTVLEQAGQRAEHASRSTSVRQEQQVDARKSSRDKAETVEKEADGQDELIGVLAAGTLRLAPFCGSADEGGDIEQALTQGDMTVSVLGEKTVDNLFSQVPSPSQPETLLPENGAVAEEVEAQLFDSAPAPFDRGELRLAVSDIVRTDAAGAELSHSDLQVAQTDAAEGIGIQNSLLTAQRDGTSALSYDNEALLAVKDEIPNPAGPVGRNQYENLTSTVGTDDMANVAPVANAALVEESLLIEQTESIDEGQTAFDEQSLLVKDFSSDGDRHLADKPTSKQANDHVRGPEQDKSHLPTSRSSDAVVPAEGTSSVSTGDATGGEAHTGDWTGSFVTSPSQNSVETESFPRGHVVEQLAEPLRQLVDSMNIRQLPNQSEEVSIRLKPEFLGEVLLKVSVDAAGTVTTRFIVDNPIVRSMIETEMGQLQAALDEHGLVLGEAHVEAGFHSFAGGQQDNGEGEGMSSKVSAVGAGQGTTNGFEDVDEPVSLVTADFMTIDIRA